jgi:isoquinoline 1-oxidoreductase beta subunit
MKTTFEGIAFHGVSRRAFLLSSGAAAVAVTFGSLATMKEAFGQGGPLQPSGWVRVGTDNIVTIYSPASEMGQGVLTAMPLLIAEEMDLDWSKCRVEQATHNPKVFGNPLFGGGMATGASRTTRGYYEVMRLAGMQARAIMVNSAARKLDVPAGELTTEPHHVVHKATGRKLTYGEIAAFAEVPAEPPQFTRAQLKPSAEFRLIGKDTPRIDVPSKVSGQAVYGIDVRIPGMLYATVLRAPVQGEKPEQIDDAEAKKVAGVKAIVPLPYGVGVVADTYWAARKSRNALKVNWSTGAKARAYTSDKIVAEYQARARNVADTGVEFVKAGDPEGALKGAFRVLQAEYAIEHVAHACMEPMNCTARVEGDKIEIWAPHQSPSAASGAVVRAAGFKPENIRFNVTQLGGGFGRRFDSDFVIDAALLAKALPGTAVKVLWTREDDIQNDKYRPIVAQHLSAALDAQGNMVALRHRIVSESIYARAAPPLFEKAGGRDAPVCEGAEHITYQVPNRVLYFLREQRGLDVGFWRGVGAGYTKFAIETLVDEAAGLAGKDPVEYRMALLSNQPRARAVIEEAARMADWKKPRAAGRALGVAYSDAWESHVAEVVEISIDRKSGRIRVHDVWCAVDPGVALQPRNVAAQMESSIMYGTSAALGEKVTFKDGVAQQSNFHDYPVLRMNEAPRVHVKVMSTQNKPGGVGEVGLPPVAAAIANAAAKLTGKRLRQLPFPPSALIKT